MATNGDLTMMIVGDVFVQRDNPTSVFDHVRHTLLKADILLGNLEGSTSEGGTPWSLKETNWKADSRQIEASASVKFSAMGVANNHIMDFGYEALFETLGHMDRLGIRHTGGGHNIDEAHAPAIVERDGCRVALLAYTSVFMADWAAGPDTPGLAVMRVHTAYEPPSRAFEVPGMPPVVRTWLKDKDKARLARDIEAARAKADIVVCSFHWGVSRGFMKVADYQTELGQYAIDLGASLVFGHHPHVLQGVEIYKGCPIFYSLGNFTFANHDLSRGHESETIIVRCQIRDRKIASVEYIPVMGDERSTPSVLSLADGAGVIRIMEKRSKPLGTKFAPNGDAVRILTGA